MEGTQLPSFRCSRQGLVSFLARKMSGFERDSHVDLGHSYQSTRASGDRLELQLPAFRSRNCSLPANTVFHVAVFH
jgi:hypothetical protein